MQQDKNPVHPHILRGMQIWCGNQSVENTVASPGIEAWICSRPFQTESRGGDVQYSSLCAGGIVTRILSRGQPFHWNRLMKFHRGQQFPSRVFTTVQGEEVAVPDPVDLVHLQFRRFVGCPICNTHIRQLRKRQDEIKAAGIRELIFFHSTADEIRPFQNDLPFDLVADSKKIIYKDIGAETSWLYFVNPKAIWAALKGMARLRYPRKMTGGPLGLPAEMLIESSGRVKAVKYGRHAYDQWSVDELLSLAGNSDPRPESSAN